VLKKYFSKTVCNVTGLGSIKKLMKHIANTLCTILQKHKLAITVAASIHFPFGSFQQQQLTCGNFSFVQNKRTTEVSWRCFYTKVQNISKFKCYMSDTLIQTGHTIASTCN